MQCNNHSSEEMLGACLRGYHINISKFDVISFFWMFYIIELHGINFGKKKINCTQRHHGGFKKIKLFLINNPKGIAIK